MHAPGPFPYLVEPYYPGGPPPQYPYGDPYLQALEAFLWPRLGSLPTAWLSGLVELTIFLDLNPYGQPLSWGFLRTSGLWQLDQQVGQILLNTAPFPPPPAPGPRRVYLRIGYQPSGLAYLEIYPGEY